MTSPKYVMLEHTTDAFWEAYGGDLSELMTNCAMALVDTIVDVKRVRPTYKDQIEVKGHDLESLLYNWLDAMIGSISINRRVYSKFETRVLRDANGQFTLAAKIWGETIDHHRHRYKTEVKGVTYHLMVVEKNGSGYKARFLLDL